MFYLAERSACLGLTGTDVRLELLDCNYDGLVGTL